MTELLRDVINMLDFDKDYILANESAKRKVEIIIENGKQYLRKICPSISDEDFQSATSARSLLFDYCRYAYSNATEMFGKNYLEDLLMLRQEYEVNTYDDSNSDEV